MNDVPVCGFETVVGWRVIEGKGGEEEGEKVFEEEKQRADLVRLLVQQKGKDCEFVTVD